MTQLSDDEWAILTGRPDFCRFCKDAGYILVERSPFQFERRACNVCGSVEEAERSRRLAVIREGSRLSPEQLTTTFEDFNVDAHPSLREVRDAAMQFAAEPKGWLVIYGKYGTGKTMLLHAIGAYLVQTNLLVMYGSVTELLAKLREGFGDNARDVNREVDALKSVDVLLLDDLGKERSTDWAQEVLFQLFDWRYANRLPTVVTTNETIPELAKRYPAIASRLADAGLSHVVHNRAPDWRLFQGKPTPARYESRVGEAKKKEEIGVGHETHTEGE